MAWLERSASASGGMACELAERLEGQRTKCLDLSALPAGGDYPIVRPSNPPGDVSASAFGDGERLPIVRSPSDLAASASGTEYRRLGGHHVAKWKAFLCLSLVASTVCALGMFTVLGSLSRPPPPPHLGPLVFLSQDTGSQSPACLDGSPYGFYFAPSSANSTRWTIRIQGFGWCQNEEECLSRTQNNFGSSKAWSMSADCGACMNVLENGRVDDDCNLIFMPYCDGASFSGFRAEPWPVPSDISQMLYFRGIKNFDATINFAFENGLDRATEFVLAGGSSGGLSTFLHVDRVAERLVKEAPNCSHVRAAPSCGYFLDHDNFQHDENNVMNNYPAMIKYIYNMQNMTSGVDGGILAACEDAYPESKHYCFMSPHMQRFIQTPFFMFNSKYDAWQLGNILMTNWQTEDTRAAVIRYGEDFVEQVMPVQSETQNGAVITSCVCHGCPWSQLLFEGKTGFQHYADWYNGRTNGSTAFHLDTRGPNGGGSLDFKECVAFP